MTTQKNQKKAYFYASLTVLLWSTVATAFKIALRDMNNIQVLFVANITSFFVLGVVLLIQRRFYEIKQSCYKGLSLSMIQGFLNPFLYYIVVFKAYSLLPAQVAQPANFIWPVVLSLMSVILLKQPLKPTSILGLLISFTGVIVLSSHGKLFSFTIIEPYGVALALISSVIWSLFWILNIEDSRDDLIKLFLSSFFSCIYVSILAISTKDLFFILSKSWLPGIYIGLFEMGITYILWLKALNFSATTGAVSNFIYLTPFVSLIFIRFVLKEELYYTSFIGLCFITAGILTGRVKNFVKYSKQE